MYGARNYNLSDLMDVKWMELEQAEAAFQLIVNLESNDIIDLIHAAIKYYDLLTIDDAEKIRLSPPVHSYNKEHRQMIVNLRASVLNARYNDSLWKDFDTNPKTVKELLVRFVWLSFYQLPEYRLTCICAWRYLKWHVFDKWLLWVAVNQGYTHLVDIGIDHHEEEEMQVVDDFMSSLEFT